MVKHSPPNQLILPQNMREKGLALYVHWPWCLKKCPYCDFNVHINENRDENVYLECLIKELEYWSAKVSKRLLTSVFIGGGTPSLMSCTVIEQLLGAIDKFFPHSPSEQGQLEVTLEANPTTLRPEMFHDFYQAGVTRFSIGVQSFNADQLAFLGRTHTPDAALSAIEAALATSAEVSLDLIYGLPCLDEAGQPIAHPTECFTDKNLDIWKQTLCQSVGLGTHHLSAYQLTIEPNSMFYGQVRKNRWCPLDDDIQADFYAATQDILSTAGLQPYEISNFARTREYAPAHVAQHNLHIWRGGDYLGIGAGAHGRVTLSHGKKVATRNFKIPETYQKEVQAKGHALFEKITLNSSETAQEAILNGLRLCEGVFVRDGEKNTSNLLTRSDFLWPNVEDCVQKNLLAHFPEPGGVRLLTTPRGQLLLDSLLPEIVR